MKSSSVGFEKKHFSETALLRVSNDIVMSSDVGDFYAVDHTIVIRRLRDWMGISGIALEWLTLSLADRSHLAVGEFVSNTSLLFCGVPQG